MMKANQVKGKRISLGLMTKTVADQLGLKEQTYRKKEAGFLKFTEKEKFKLGKILDLTLAELDEFLFDGQISHFFFLQNANWYIVFSQWILYRSQR